MVHWIARLHHRRQQRKVHRAALEAVGQGQGVAARTWPISPAHTADQLTVIRGEAQTWLAAQIATAASPYGWSDCSVLMALARSADV